MGLSELIKNAAKVKGDKGTAMYEMLCCLESVEGRIDGTNFPQTPIEFNEFLLEALEDMKKMVIQDVREELGKLPLYLKEFYSPIKAYGLHPLPKFITTEGWDDTSWHNNVCPSWLNEKLSLEVWVGFSDNAEMEKAYLVQELNKDGEWIGDVLATDSLEELEKFIGEWKAKN